jgi:UBX domain-containing protein 1
MNVQHDQAVDVKLHQHETPYKPQPKKYKPFSGAGQRLGSPVPGVGGSAPPPATSNAPTSSSTAATANPEPTIDSSQPTVMIRIQMPDGTRLPARFNTTNTVGDIYGFVQGASPETRTRAWVLATTFPNKEHTDKDLVLSDVSEFKKGGTAVVKWA